MNRFEEKCSRITEILNDGITNDLNINKLNDKYELTRDFIYDFYRKGQNLVNNGHITQEDFDNFKSIYEKHRDEINEGKVSSFIEKRYDSKTYEADPVSYDSEIDDGYDERSTSSIIRSDNEYIDIDNKKTGKITGYKYNILIRDNEPLAGEFTREEMDLIYKLYSLEGANLTQRTVSRYFPQFSFGDFKRILRAFNISKNSISFAPHILEEKSVEEAIELTLRLKETEYLKKLEEKKIQYNEQRVKELTAELFKIRNNINQWKEIVSDFKYDVTPEYLKKNIESKTCMMVYISDAHVGCYVDDTALYENKYDGNEFLRRLKIVLDRIVFESKRTPLDAITICNLGDSLDGWDKSTTRGGHNLPQNMSNREQYKTFVGGMIYFFDTLHKLSICNSIDYICVGDANHDGDFGYITNSALALYLNTKYPEIHTRIFEKFIEHFTYGATTSVLCHGKDKEDNFKNLPLVLDQKTEIYISKYLDYHNLSGKIRFIKGDLHMSATSESSRFVYKSVGSLFGSSKWISTNFAGGVMKPTVDFDLIEKETGDVLSGQIHVK